MTLHFRNISLTYVCTKQIFFFFFSELNKTKIYYIAQSDIGGYVPRSLIDNTLPQAVMDFFSNIKKTIEADGCNEFSFWCWLPTLQDALTSIKRQTADVVLSQITIQLFINMYRPDTSTLCIDTTTHYAVCMYHTKTADKSPYTLLKQRWYIFLWILMYSFHGLTDLTNFLYSMVMQAGKVATMENEPEVWSWEDNFSVCGKSRLTRFGREIPGSSKLLQCEGRWNWCKTLYSGLAIAHFSLNGTYLLSFHFVR